MQSSMFLILISVGISSAFFFNQKIDCQVSDWSEWEGPLGFGEYERYRTVLAHPANGGETCPVLSETKAASRAPTILQTARLLTDKFLARTSSQKTRDLLILFDASGSIGSSNFAQALKNLAELLGLLCPNPDPFVSTAIGYHQAAMIKFSGTPVEEFFFGQKYPTSVLKNAIRNVQYIGGSTCTGDAFKAAINMFRSTNKGVRTSSSVQKEVLIVTDGESNCGFNAIQAAEELKNTTFSPLNDKVKVYGLMIGIKTSLGQQEVTKYVSSPVGNHLFAVPGFEDLDKLLDETRNLVQRSPPCAPIEI